MRAASHHWLSFEQRAEFREPSAVSLAFEMRAER